MQYTMCLMVALSNKTATVLRIGEHCKLSHLQSVITLRLKSFGIFNSHEGSNCILLHVLQTFDDKENMAVNRVIMGRHPPQSKI